jgi:nitrogen fixation NifU-like protein
MDSLYHETLLEIYKHPLNKKALQSFDFHAKQTNPLCGDMVEVFIKWSKAGTVAAIGWQGEGCAISQTSSSLVTDSLKEKSKADIKKITKEHVLQMLGLENLNPTRLRCALLILESLKNI